VSDVHNAKTRSFNMSKIKSKNTKPELILRKAIHAKGLRYKLHDKSLPGRPDIVFPKFKAIIEIKGCFWHGHDCDYFKWPKTHSEFWKKKISSNIERDKKTLLRLQDLGWRTLTIWECTLKGKNKLPLPELTEYVESWLAEYHASTELDSKKIKRQPT
jgi:DNA mismatch endonuclease, patch repair protein